MDELLRTLILVSAYLVGASGLALVLTRFSASGRRIVAQMFGGHELWFAFAVAVGMTASSLWFSEVFGYEPCRLCWFQRIGAYPIVAIAGWGALRRDRNAWAPALTMAVVGIAVSIWHILLDTVGLGAGSCSAAVPCTTRWTGFDTPYSTIQVGAFCGFLFIIGVGLHALATPSSPAVSTSDTPPPSS